MAYGVKYILQWTTASKDNLYFNISAKDYVGPVTELILIGININYNTGDDRVISPFKTSSLNLSYRNELNTPIEIFYSEDDEFFKGELFDGSDNTLRWAGFLQQDDSSQAFQDPPHPVNLVFTDNLGFLKDITYDVATQGKVIDYKTLVGVLIGHGLNFPNAPNDYGIVVGDHVTIEGVNYEIVSVTYTPVVPGVSASNLKLNLLNLPGPQPGFYPTTIPVKSPVNLLAKPTLWSILRTAIQNAGLDIPVRVFNNLYETSHDENKNMFDQTRVFTGKWLDENGVWTNIYSMAEEILNSFDATLFQADGYFNIIRWGELNNFPGNAFPGIAYDANFENPQAVTFNCNFDVFTTHTNNELINADALHKLLRPFSLVRETFYYHQPRELIRNINLQEAGDLLRAYADGDLTVREYTVPYWQAITNNPGTPDFFLRVISDALEVEQERYLVLSGGTFGGAWFSSGNFYMNEKDRVSVSMSFRTSDNQTGDSTNVFEFRLDSQSATKYIHWNDLSGIPDGTFANGAGAVFFYPSAVDIHEWQSFKVDSLGAPFNGYFSIGLNQLDFDSPIHETHYKDITIIYTPYINDSTQITGHSHTSDAGNGAKKKYDETITIDDSPRNSVEGALFTDALDWAFQYQTLTSAWGLKGETKNKRLGQFIVTERHRLQREVRTLLDFTAHFDCPLLSPMNVLFISSVIQINFIFGVCRFDFDKMECSGTLWQIHYTGEGGFLTVYTFKYLYNTN